MLCYDVLSFLVLSCDFVVLCRLVLSCIVSSCPVLSCVALFFCLVLSCLVLLCLILSCLVSSRLGLIHDNSRLFVEEEKKMAFQGRLISSWGTAGY